MPTLKERYKPNIPNKPYLIEPVAEHLDITEGFIYTKSERERHGNHFHKGVDYETKWGAPVLASASGYAIAGYHRFPILNKDGTLRLSDGQPMSNGLGYFVQIYHPEKISGIPSGRITQYGHLSRFGEGIKARILPKRALDIPKLVKKHFTKTELTLRQQDTMVKEQRALIAKYPWVSNRWGYRFGETLEKLETYGYTLKEVQAKHKKGWEYVKWVDQGDVIGYTGASAVVLGTMPYKEGEEKPNVNPFENTWDEIHLHFEEATRNPEDRIKHLSRDPYGLYLGHTHYPGKDKDSLFI